VADSYGITGFAWIKQEDRMVKRVGKHAVLFLVLSLLSTAVALAQANPAGRLTGTVTDQRGGMIRDAEIRAKNERTGSEFVAITNRTGVWAMNSILSSNYTVTVNAQGFRTKTIDEVKVETGITKTVDVTLQIGFEDEITVTASKYEEEVINAPATVSVISEQAIQALPTQNIGDLLREVPGVNVNQMSASHFGINTRAASAAYPPAQLALIDGRTIYQDSYSYVAWNIVPTSLDDIKQIEVVRGPGSAIWGANAMNGVVNIITKSARESSGTTLTLGMGTFDRTGGVAGSNSGSLYYLNASHAQALNERWAFRLTGGAYTQDAFARPEGNIPNQINLIPSPSFINKGTTQPKVDGRLDYDFPDGRQNLKFAGGYARSSGITHGPLGGGQDGMSSSYGKVDYVRDTLRISGYASNFDYDMPFLIRLDPSGQPLLWSGHDRAYHFEFSDLRKAGARHLLSYGGNLRFSTYNSVLAPELSSRQEGGVYLQDEIGLSEHFRWVVGARVDKFGDLDGVLFSPRTAFMIKPTPHQTFRLSYNRAYTAPNLLEEYYKFDVMSWWDLEIILMSPVLAGYSHPWHFEGNRNLEAPTLNAYEIGYSAVMAKDRLHFGAAFYINDTSKSIYYQAADSYTSLNPPPGWPLPPEVLDLLIAVNAFGPGMGLPSNYVTQNRSEGSKTRDKGIEISVDAHLSRAIDVFSNYSWQAKPVTTGFSVDEINHPPAHRFNVGMNFNYRRYMGNVSVGYVGRAYWQDVTLYGGYTDAYTTINLMAGARIDRSGKYTAMLKISNLANELIQNHIYGDIMKRQITGEFKMRF
jgi:outer membrane receptor protein involved in Fe transport